MIASVGVCTRPSETAPSNELRRRIVAARVAFMPTIQSASERERAACSSRSNSCGRAQRCERLLHRRVRHRVQPQPFHRLLALRLLVQVGEDQLALAAGVAGVDDLLDVLAAELFGDDRHLLARALVAHDQLELLGHDRQVGHPPALVLRVVRVRLGELHEVPDRPGDHVLGTLQLALLLLERARSARARGPAPRRASRRSPGSSTWRSA